ncbi:hypothetical protein L3X38_029349 [Prunus dulcis]|uniref:Cytochrome P450 n=1 Tax=Prunus dulcis TaxID=3755 RepID=A0AAD4VTF4_PRUDU|nr:hypothetical protein L3X38_029349 [Prunus dulcis]
MALYMELDEERSASASIAVRLYCKNLLNFPEKSPVILWIRYLHTNPENFDDPVCFNPERWSESIMPGTYQVYGGGPRICPGNMLFKIQLPIFLHHLSTGYKWELIDPEADIIYLKHPTPADRVDITFSKNEK